MTRPVSCAVFLVCQLHILSCFATTEGPSAGHYTLTVHNGSGDGDYNSGDDVEISAAVPSGYSFLRWMQIGGGGHVQRFAGDTKFTMPGRSAVIAAVFGKIESWFPPGPEDGTKGILLAKNPEAETQARMEQRIRVSLDVGDASGELEVSEVWDTVGVKVDWFPSVAATDFWHSMKLVKYFDAKENGTEIRRDSAVPKSLFQEVSSGVYEATIWYEGAWTQAEAAKVVDSDGNPVRPEVLTSIELDVHGKNFATTRATAPGTLLPIEMKVVDRDDPKKKWGSEKDQNQSKPVYAGESAGDMVSWKLDGTDSWSSTVFTWTAEGPGGETITGPTGAGKNEWTINDDDQDTATNWLKWKPGKWKINVKIGSTKAEFEQEVGWRTEDYVVIGQIVPMDTHNDDKPPFLGGYPWAPPSPGESYRRALLYDMFGTPIFTLPTVASTLDAIAQLDAPWITSKLTEFWFGYWYFAPTFTTPKGPFSSSRWSGQGHVENGHRFWALQHVFNVSPDAPLAPESFSDDTFDTLRSEEQYRIIHRYKSKFVLTSDGKINSENVVQIKHVAEGGPTKMNFGIAQGEFLPAWDNPAVTFFQVGKQSSDTHEPYQGKQTVSEDGKRISYYATGRVGAGGQNVNWRLMGKDAPWIFSEIIVEIQADRTVTELYKTSVDASWSEATGRQGETPFNNLNLYKADYDPEDNNVIFLRKDLMPMEGELEPFINSASGQRPEPPIPPSVQ